VQVITTGKSQRLVLKYASPVQLFVQSLTKLCKPHYAGVQSQAERKNLSEAVILHTAGEHGYMEVLGIYTDWNLILELQKQIFPCLFLKTKSFLSYSGNSRAPPPPASIPRRWGRRWPRAAYRPRNQRLFLPIRGGHLNTIRTTGQPHTEMVTSLQETEGGRGVGHDTQVPTEGTRKVSDQESHF